MAYHPLTNDTGGTADDRRAEANRILKMITESGLDDDTVTKKEAEFLENMVDHMIDPISPKQLFWLRDIKDKYL